MSESTLRRYASRKKGRRISPIDASSIAIQIAAGITAKHRDGQVGLDLRPQTIRVLDSGQSIRASITDLTSTAGSGVPASSRYSAPELVNGGSPSSAADIFSLGAVLVEMLLGHVPTSAKLSLELSKLGLPSSFISLISECLSTNPAQRPSADQVASRLFDLEPELASSPPQRPPVGLWATVMNRLNVSPRARSWALGGIGLLAALLAVALAWSMIHIGGAPPTTQPTQRPSQPPSADLVPAVTTLPPDCNPLKITVAASTEKAALMTELANRYNHLRRGADGRCYSITVVSAASGRAESNLAAGWDRTQQSPPDVWSPAASTWVSLLRADRARSQLDDITPHDTPSIAATPLVLAMPELMARTLGWPDADIGWADILRLARDPAGWRTMGHPEWGRFKLGKTNPRISTSGLAATVGTLAAAAGSAPDLDPAKLNDPAVRDYLRDLEQSVIHYGDTTLTFLTNLSQAQDPYQYVSAVAVEEKSVLDYNAGNPAGTYGGGPYRRPDVPLVAIYPKEGTLYSDNPYVVLNAAWSTEAKKRGARDFLAYLLADAQQNAFTDAGFRKPNHDPGTPIEESHSVRAGGATVTLNPPDGDVLGKVRELWGEVRRPARVLLLTDLSDSMGDPAGPLAPTKLQLAQNAAKSSLRQLLDTDYVALWTFPKNGRGPYQFDNQILPIGALRDRRGEIDKTIDTLEVHGDTPLYSALQEAHTAMAALTDPRYINAIVVLSDGHNNIGKTSPSGAKESDGLLAALRRGATTGATDSQRLRVFSIAYGADSNKDTLRQISAASQAATYDASNPQTLDDVMADVLSNF